jgi:glucosamine-6-phosphate isomerase
MIKIIIVENYEEMSDKAFEVMSEVLQNPKAVIGLATGSSPVGLYQRMVQDYKNNGISYQEVTTFNLDEYLGLPRDHKESYYTFMHQNLFNEIDLKEENIHIPNGSVADIEQEAKDYEAQLQEYDIDIQLTGIGANGHIGFNEPGTPFDSVTHIVDLDEKTRLDNARFFNDDINEVPTQAITMGIASIKRAKKVLLLASGANKADAIYGMIKGESTPDLPASALQDHDDVIVIADKAAASKL